MQASPPWCEASPRWCPCRTPRSPSGPRSRSRSPRCPRPAWRRAPTTALYSVILHCKFYIMECAMSFGYNYSYMPTGFPRMFVK